MTIATYISFKDTTPNLEMDHHEDTIPNLEMDLYAEFGIQMRSRQDVTVSFTIHRNSTVEKYKNLVIRALCFYTLGLFETSSGSDGFLVYQDRGVIVTKSIEAACRDYIESMQDFYDEKGEFNYPRYTPNVHPIKTYLRERQDYIGIGYGVGKPGDNIILDSSRLNDSRFDTKITVQVESIVEPPEHQSILDLDDPPLIAFTPISPITTEYHRYPVDTFTIWESEPNYYECTFSPREGYHHASCYTAAKCTVSWTNYRVNDLSSIYLQFIPDDETITVNVTYDGIDCL